MKFSEWPVILEVYGEKRGKIYQIKDVAVPKGFKNLVLKAKGQNIHTAVLIREGYYSEVIDVSTPEKRKAFEKKYSLSLPDTVPPNKN